MSDCGETGRRRGETSPRTTEIHREIISSSYGLR